eukprot:499558_1
MLQNQIIKCLPVKIKSEKHSNSTTTVMASSRQSSKSKYGPRGKKMIDAATKKLQEQSSISPTKPTQTITQMSLNSNNKSPDAMSTSSSDKSTPKFDYQNETPTKNFTFGTDIDTVITPVTISSEQTEKLTERIAKPFINQHQKILSQRRNNMKYARMQRALEMEVDCNSTDNDNSNKENNNNNTHHSDDDSIQNNNNNNNTNKDDLIDNNNSNNKKKNSKSDYSENNDNKNINKVDSMDNDKDDYVTKKNTSKKQSAKEKQTKRTQNGYSLYNTLRNCKWFKPKQSKTNSFNVLVQSKQYETTIQKLLHKKSKSKKKKTNTKIKHTKSTVDDKARGLRLAHISSAGTGLIIKGTKNDKVSRLAFRFGLAALPWTCFQTIEDVSFQRVWPFIRLLTEATTTKTYDKVKKGNSKKTNQRSHYWYYYKPLFLTYIIQKYFNYNTQQQAIDHIENDSHTVEDYENALKKNGIILSWKNYYEPWPEIYGYNKVQWQIQYNSEIRDFENIDNDSESQIEYIPNEMNILNEINISNEINMVNEITDGVNKRKNMNRNISLNNFQSSSFASPFVDKDGRPDCDICYFIGDNKHIVCFTGLNLKYINKEIVQSNVLEIELSVSNIPQTPKIQGAQFLRSKTPPDTIIRKYNIQFANQMVLSLDNCIVYMPGCCGTQLYALYGISQSGLPSTLIMPSSINNVQLPVPNVDRFLNRKGNALQSSVSSGLIKLTENDLSDELYEPFYRSAGRSLSDIHQTHLTKFIQGTLMYYPIVQKYTQENGRIGIALNDCYVEELLCERKAYGSLHGAFLLFAFKDIDEDDDDDGDDDIDIDTDIELDLCCVFLKPNLGGLTKVINLDDEKIWRMDMSWQIEKGHVFLP